MRKKKLHLKAETIRTLDDPELRVAVGGYSRHDPGCGHTIDEACSGGGSCNAPQTCNLCPLPSDRATCTFTTP